MTPTFAAPGSFLREHFPENLQVEVPGVHGQVGAVHSVGIVPMNDSGLVTVPNTVLIENVVE
jgi:hypothetical protein